MTSTDRIINKSLPRELVGVILPLLSYRVANYSLNADLSAGTKVITITFDANQPKLPRSRRDPAHFPPQRITRAPEADMAQSHDPSYPQPSQAQANDSQRHVNINIQSEPVSTMLDQSMDPSPSSPISPLPPTPSSTSTPSAAPTQEKKRKRINTPTHPPLSDHATQTKATPIPNTPCLDQTTQTLIIETPTPPPPLTPSHHHRCPHFSYQGH
ncbi:putative uncharacterized protein DDB_G0290521 [Haliotis rufescens]|uniref:putative uncharacterized protein DDB_G0290521 n=1 Tax=Haliotis rufescens TaxID=6454 RepID=UPI00201FA1B4|nr:putative uncharacterized protein DDB_G0290521 [Haliotis rufescens]